MAATRTARGRSRDSSARQASTSPGSSAGESSPIGSPGPTTAKTRAGLRWSVTTVGPVHVGRSSSGPNDADAVCLTAVGVKRSLPVPGRAFWEFDKGPTFVDVEALDEWLTWLLARLGRQAARLRMAPPAPLCGIGDDVETVLERHGFQRRRVLGGWATLVGDMCPEEDQILRTFRPTTRARIRKSVQLGIEVGIDDTPAGWAVLSALESDLARRAPVRLVQPTDIASVSRCWLRHGSGGTILVASHEKEPLAAALVIKYRTTAHLAMMASSRRHSELPASHLLVWESMRWAKSHGCTAFDFAGYSLVAQPGDTLWGVNEFKRGFVTVEAIRKSVAVHERVRSPLLAASAQAIRDAQTRWHRDRGPARPTHYTLIRR